VSKVAVAGSSSAESHLVGAQRELLAGQQTGARNQPAQQALPQRTVDVVVLGVRPAEERPSATCPPLDTMSTPLR